MKIDSSRGQWYLLVSLTISARRATRWRPWWERRVGDNDQSHNPTPERLGGKGEGSKFWQINPKEENGAGWW